MSTKSSIEFDNELGVHLYHECGDFDAVYLNLYGKNVVFDVGHSDRGSEVTIRIPLEVWDLICKNKGD